jgi:hypothetical protein
MLPTTTFLIPHVLPNDNPVDESVQWSDDDRDEFQMDMDEDDEDDEEDGEPLAKRRRTEPPAPETPASGRTRAQVASSVGSTSIISVPRQKVPTTIPVVEIQVSSVSLFSYND